MSALSHKKPHNIGTQNEWRRNKIFEESVKGCIYYDKIQNGVIEEELNIFSIMNCLMTKWTDHQKRMNFSKIYICIIPKEREMQERWMQGRTEIFSLQKNMWNLKIKAVVFVPCSSVCNIHTAVFCLYQVIY